MEPWMISTAAGLLTIGGAYGGTKAALNGTRERVKALATDFEKHANADDIVQRDISDRMARMETKIDLLLATKALMDK